MLPFSASLPASYPILVRNTQPTLTNTAKPNIIRFALTPTIIRAAAPVPLFGCLRIVGAPANVHSFFRHQPFILNQ